MSTDFYKIATRKDIRENYEAQQKLWLKEAMNPAPKEGAHHTTKQQENILTGKRSMILKEYHSKEGQGSNGALSNRVITTVTSSSTFKNRFRQFSASNMSPPKESGIFGPKWTFESGNQTNQHGRQFSSKTLEEPPQGANQSSQAPKTTIKEAAEIQGPECKICFSRGADMVCIPCGHAGICETCALKHFSEQSICFLCKSEVQFLTKIDPKKQVGQMLVVVKKIKLVVSKTRDHRSR